MGYEGGRWLEGLAHWPRLLAEYLAENRRRPFEFGTFDCCFFAGGAVAAMTGRDVMAEYRDTVHDARSSAVYVDAHGGVAAMLAAKKEFTEVPILRAQRGDVILMDSPDGRGVVGVCTGAAVAYVQPEGLATAPLRAVGKRAWRWA